MSSVFPQHRPRCEDPGSADTICAVATPPGAGALGVLRLSGPRALEMLRAACGVRRFEARRLRLLSVRGGDGERIDRVLAVFLPGPRSYTAEDMAEIYAHGGALNLRRILERLLELGARLAQPGEFTRRAFLGGRIDLTQAEAVCRVISAESERALANAQAQLGGRLRAAVAELREELLALAAELEARIDFGEELAAASPAAAEEALAARQQRALAAALGLARSYEIGRRLELTRVGLVGAVNVGKSSLFNRLIGATRALVCAEPGTTRDFLEADVERRGHRIRFVDAAGLRARADEIERAGQELALPVLARCDLLLLVVELGADATTAELPPALAARPRLLVCNKCDLLTPAEREEALEGWRERTGAGRALGASALTGEGIGELEEEIERLLFGGDAGGELVYVTEERQSLALERAAAELGESGAALARGLPPEIVVEHVRAARDALEEVTGELATEAVLDQVFARFCIGK